MGRLGRTAKLPTTTSFGRIDPTNATMTMRVGRALGGVCFMSSLPLSPLTATCTHTHNTSHVSSCNSFVTLSSAYSRRATHLVGHRMSSKIVTPSCAPRTLRVLHGGHGNACGIVGVSPTCHPTPVRRGSMFNVAFRRKHGRLGVSRSLLGRVPAQGRRVPASTGHSLLVTLVALGCARSGSMYCTGSKRTVNVNTKRRSHVRYAHLTKGGTSV